MTEPTFTPETGGADIKQYENVDLSTLNTSDDELPPTERRLEKVLIKSVFITRVGAWVSIALFIFMGLYGWTRNQTQESWLMKLDMNTDDNPLCKWMNRGYAEQLKKDSVFRDYLTAQGKKSYVDLLNRGHCIAPDTIADWLEIQKTYMSEELAKKYETIIPKKFLATTIASSPELDVIAENSPGHRMQHAEMLDLLSETLLKFVDTSAKITCQEVRFEELTLEANCEAVTRPPVQPRLKAMAFMKELSLKDTILVTYPSSLDMQVDARTNTLKTNFTVKLAYIPSRYEAATIQKLTYDKR